MALDPKIKKLLNDFSKSQPALQLPGQPFSSANPMLGDLLEDALSVAAGEATYAPATPGNWSPAPALLSTAVDQLASRMKADEVYAPAVAGDWSPAPTAQDAALDQLAARVKAQEDHPYTAGTPGDWTTSAPTTTWAAIDRIAAAVAGLLVGTIP